MFAEDPSGGARAGTEVSDALRKLEQRLDRASQAAEALMAEAAGAAARGAAGLAAGAAATGATGASGEPGAEGGTAAPGAAGQQGGAAGSPPPSGWQLPREETSTSPSVEDALVRMVASLRDLVPPELQRRLAEAVRELLLALRALIDWYLERVERHPPVSSEPQDIPIL